MPPSWVQDTIFYQIFPDRFANGDPSNDPPNVLLWGSPPPLYGFMGGDLEGVIQKLDYLTDLGINAIYFNPIFAAGSNHRYDAIDYLQIDPKLGDLATFQRLVRLAHNAGIRVVLDGVFNHCGRGFFAFADLVQNEEASPYRNWFHVEKFPLNPYGEGDANYQCWWNFKSLPKFNTREPQVRQYLLNVTRYWLEQGIDGWRLDVPSEIDDDEFWAEFAHTVRRTNPQAYTLGEIWKADKRWVGKNKFDALMNYPFRTAALDFFGTDQISAAAFGEAVESLLTVYPRPHVYAQFNPLGSHDTERFLTLCQRDVARFKLALLFQFTYVGAPSIYYGDEIGLDGGKDPECRKAFNWKPKEWHTDLRDHIKQLAVLRKDSIALRRGEFKRLTAHAGIYAFQRQHDLQSLVVILNNNAQAATYTLNLKTVGWQHALVVRDLLSGKRIKAENQRVKVRLSARTGMVLAV